MFGPMFELVGMTLGFVLTMVIIIVGICALMRFILWFFDQFF